MAIKSALIVDDSKSARFVLKRMLAELKLDVETVESASVAIEYLKDHTPDVIFMDHMMPGMDGFEAVKQIKSNAKTAIIPIMMYTSRGGDVYLSQAKALGAVGVIPKTISPVGLKESLFKLGLVKDRRTSSSGKMEAGQVDRRKPQDSAIEEKLATVKAETKHLQDAPLDAPQAAVKQNVPSPVIPASTPDNREAKESLLRKQSEHDTYIEDLRKLMDEQTIELHKSMWLGIETVSHEIFNRLNGELEEKFKSMQAAGSNKGAASEAVAGTRSGWAFLLVAIILLVSIILNVTLLFNASKDETVVGAAATAIIAVTDASVEISDANAPQQSSVSDSQKSKDAFIQWAQNREIQYPFDELALNENRLSSIEEIVNKAVESNYTGKILLQTHVGRFCLSRGESDNYVLSKEDISVMQCDYIGNYMQPDDVSSTHQSLSFANYLSGLNLLSEKGIDVDVSSVSRSVELSKYPKKYPQTTAEEWNLAATLNNRIIVILEPY